METIVALGLAAVLTPVALLHAYWAFGGLWPGADEAALARTVVGDPRSTRMPGRGLTLLVAAAILVTAAWPLLIVGHLSTPLPGLGVILVGGAIGAVFISRGVAGYLPFWRRRVPVEPFATLDRKLYSPLCLAVGGGYLFLIAAALSRPAWP